MNVADDEGFVRQQRDLLGEDLARTIDDAICCALQRAGLDPSDEGLGLYDLIADQAAFTAALVFDAAVKEAEERGEVVRFSPELDICECCLAPMDLL